VNHFIQEDFEGLFESKDLVFFPQFDRKRKEIIAPIHDVREKIKSMTSNNLINRASRIIVLFSHDRDFLYPAEPRIEDESILEELVNDRPCFPLDMDDAMVSEDEETVREIEAWWASSQKACLIEPEKLRALAIDEEGSNGMAVKWLTSDNVDASPPFCMREVTILAGGFTPSHAHAWEHQIYVLKGSGRVLRHDKNRPLRIRPESAIRIPPDVPHQLLSDKGNDLKYLDIIPSITHFFGR
jgi:quercetin dioxygenase-like cupin family protein